MRQSLIACVSMPDKKVKMSLVAVPLSDQGAVERALSVYVHCLQLQCCFYSRQHRFVQHYYKLTSDPAAHSRFGSCAKSHLAPCSLSPPMSFSHWHLQYTSRAAQMYKQQLEKDVAKFDTATYLSGLKGKAAEPAAVTAAVKEADKEAVATNGSASSRPSSQNGSTNNLAGLDDSSIESAPASSTASATSAQGELLLLFIPGAAFWVTPALYKCAMMRIHGCCCCSFLALPLGDSCPTCVCCDVQTLLFSTASCWYELFQHHSTHGLISTASC